MINGNHDELASVFENWWRLLNDATEEGERGERSNRADAARLRRIGTVDTPIGPDVDVGLALTVEALRDLHGRVRRLSERSRRWQENLVVAAVTLAHVRKLALGRSTAAMLGQQPDNDRFVMAEPRFLRLIRTRTSAELLDEGRRIATLLKDGAPVGDLGASLMVWLDDPNRRRLWAQAYYGLNSPPASTEISRATQPQIGTF